MLEALTYLASGLGVILLALLCLPIVLAASVSRTDDPDAVTIRLDGTVFAGLVGVRVRQTGATRRLYPLLRRWAIGGGRALGQSAVDEGDASDVEPRGAAAVSPGPDAAAKVEAEEERSLATSVRDTIGRAQSLARRVGEMSRLLARPGLQLLSSLRRAARLRRLSVRGRLGLDDPATTGSACAWLHGIRTFQPRRVSIDVTPDFVHPRVEGSADVVVHLYLGYALACVVRFGVRVGLGWLVMRLRAVLSRAAARVGVRGRLAG